LGDLQRLIKLPGYGRFMGDRAADSALDKGNPQRSYSRKYTSMSLNFSLLQLIEGCGSKSQNTQDDVAWQAGVSLSRAQFSQHVQAWRNGFMQANVGPSVALYFENSFEFAGALLGAWQAAKQVYLPSDVQPNTVQVLSHKVQHFAGQWPEHLPQVRQRQHSVASGHLHAGPLPETALVVFTSGSSAEPVAIGKTLGQLQAELHSLETQFGSQVHGAVVHSTVSHQHLYGLLFQVLWPLSAGRTFSAERLVYPQEIINRLKQTPRSVLVSSPAHLKRLPQELGWHDVREHLQTVFCSGDALPQAAAQASEQLLGQAPIEILGSSETGGIAWRESAHKNGAGPWQALPGVEWRLEAHSTDDSSAASSAVLSVRSAHLPDPTAWHRTTDRVQSLADSSSQQVIPANKAPAFKLLGRNDRVVKIQEKRLSLHTLETQLLAGDELVEAHVLVLPQAKNIRHRDTLAVVAIPSAIGWVLLAQGKRQLNEKLRQRLLQSTGHSHLPRHYRYVKALPMNAQGKTPAALLVELFRPELPHVHWQERHTQRAAGHFVAHAQLMAFQGHFEDQPILPGVALLDWAIHWGCNCFGIETDFLQIQALKFQRPVLPDTALEIELHWTPGENKLKFRYQSPHPNTLHATGTALFHA
jgi:acyl-coenzyme A synthetase/AMP-(fatty) acid ligase